MLIDSPTIMGGIFHRCRHARPDSGELLALLNDVLVIVEQQGKFLIDVPDGWVPDKWVKAVCADTRRGIEYMDAMNLRDHDTLSPNNRLLFSMVQLVVRELQRLWAINAKVTVQRLGYAFHNVSRCFRTKEELNSDSGMFYFRIISAHWNELSMETREACCRVVGLELDKAETLIKTAGFCINSKIGSQAHLQ